jgi:hypothetical protein
MSSILPYAPQKDMAGRYAHRGSYRLVASTGAVTTIAARTATAGFLFTMRNPTSSAAALYVKRVGARFIATTAYGTAQETGVDMILARSYTASATGGTAVDVGSTVANTGNLAASFSTSVITANCTRVADTGALTAGTQTLDANPFGIVSGWTTGIGIMVPEATSGAASGFADLWNYRKSEHGMPIKLVADEGFVIRNLILMGATGVGRWDFLVEWDEGLAES